MLAALAARGARRRRVRRWRRRRHGRRRSRRRTTTTTAPEAAGRAAHRAARPDRRRADAAGAQREDREHAAGAAAVRARRGRRRLRRGRRGQHHPVPRDVPLRSRPTSSVRSARCGCTDPSIVWPVGGIFAFSGGAPYASSTRSTPRRSKLVDENTRRRRDVPRHARRARRTTCSATPDAPVRDRRRSRCRRRRCSRTSPTGKPVPASPRRVGRDRVHRRATRSTYTWDAAHGHLAALDGRSAVHDAAPARQIAPQNVVVLPVVYRGRRRATRAPRPSSSARATRSSSPAATSIPGTWTRPDKAQPMQLVDAGRRRRSSSRPGQTWVELPDVSYPVDVRRACRSRHRARR